MLFYGLLDPLILLILGLTVFLNYRAALWFERNSASMRRRKYLFTLILVVNLSFLAFFKYITFLAGNVDAILFLLHLPLLPGVPDILLPVGISFYTFQLISYLADVYYNRIRALQSYSDTLLYTLYFPQLVAGPIERAEHLAPLLQNPPGPKREQVYRGAFLFLEGLFKKLAVADVLSPLVDASLLPGAPAPAWGHWITAILFAIQIYADFSGYTDMARGISLFFGIELSENFSLPFLAPHPAEFWRRWHITLMSFLRDYLYFPLGGSSRSRLRTFINVMIVFSLGGLWHGASFGHLSWGIYSGLLVALTNSLFSRKQLATISEKIYFRIPGIIFTFFSFAAGTLLIRMKSWNHFLDVFSAFFPADPSIVLPVWFLWALLFSLPLFGMDLLRGARRGSSTYDAVSPALRSLVSLFWILAVFLYGASEAREFIYFQF